MSLGGVGIAPTPALPRFAGEGAGRVGGAGLREAALAFEAQALGALLQPMFESVPTKGPFGGGSAEGQWRPMLVDAIARDLARAGGLGIADAVHRELLRLQEERAMDGGVNR